MIIAFIGNDGSGKTTIANRFSRILKKLGFEVTCKHEYNYVTLNFILSLFGSKKIAAERQKMIIDGKKDWKYYVWPFLVWCDVSLSYIYYRLFKRRSIIVLDRYLFDHYMSFKKLGCLTPISDWLFRNSLRPKATILLWVEPRIAYHRKKATHSYELDFYIQQTEGYLKLSEIQGINAVNTNQSIGQTINKILEALPSSLVASLWERGLQNKVLFSVAEESRIRLPDKLTSSLVNRKKKSELTFRFITEFFSQLSITEYEIIKTYYQPVWAGNDVDVMVSFKEFEKIVSNIPKTADITLRQKAFEEGKVDINLSRGLAIDLHSYIGWRKVVFIRFHDLFIRDRIMKKHGLNFAEEKINSIIILLTHVFEKGFVTLHDMTFLKSNFDELYLQNNFPYLSILLNEYVAWLKSILALEKNSAYPIFIPVHIIINCYVKLLIGKYNGSPLNKSKATLRDLPIMLFWRIRYCIKSKLPFEVNWYN